MYFLSTNLICSIINVFSSEYITDKSYKHKMLFQTQQNLSQVFRFFPRHLPYCLFLCQREQMQDEKALVKSQLNVANTSKQKAFFLFIFLHTLFSSNLKFFSGSFLCACMVDTCETLRRLIVVLFSLNPCFYFEMQVLLLQSKEKDLSSLSTLTLLVRRQTETNHSQFTKHTCKQPFKYASFSLCAADWQLMGRTINSFRQLKRERQSNIK